MTTVEGDVVLTRDLSSGRVHKRVRLGANLATFEGCNLDSAGAYEVLIGLPLGAKLCHRCFPERITPRDPSDPTDEGTA